uniref:Uncharacterized protein n=1 Tax=Podoviridae sp. ct8mF2 TaxID=2825224 RepID=A0A8S5PMN6_9CAUD|nr:MAG TPA: hypothetical protein [Podoviridae sp. ct8mF2]
MGVFRHLARGVISLKALPVLNLDYCVRFN